MATNGTLSISVTLPPTGANDENNVSRAIARELLRDVDQALGGGTSTGGDLVYDATHTVSQTLGAWTFTPAAN